MPSPAWLSVLSLAVFLPVGLAHYDPQQTYIVQMSNELKPSAFPSHPHWYESCVRSAKSYGMNAPSVDLEHSNILHVYNTVFEGFSVRLSAAEADALQAQPGVERMFPDAKAQLHTTHSPEFLGLNPQSGLWPISNYGEDTIVGVLDSGVWPERKSFSDHDVGPVPARWKGGCVDEPTFSSSLCNRKLIGAKYYCKGYESESGRVNVSAEFKSPRDANGHGTHTASIAAGSSVVGASLLGVANGTARGMAPNARIAVYKVCWIDFCFNSDILAGFDAAVADGVDIISISLGIPEFPVYPFYLDPIAIGAWAAAKKGILVSASAGNGGNYRFTVTNDAPWIFTIAASTIDRAFPANVKLANGDEFAGSSLYGGHGLTHAMQSVIYAANASLDATNTTDYIMCQEGTLDPRKVKGKIVVCDMGQIYPPQQGLVVKKAGGEGLILANPPRYGETIYLFSHFLPATAVGAKAGDAIRSYLLSTTSPEATITFPGAAVGEKPAPVIPRFSARGPSEEASHILKPDITAPGVNILGAWTGNKGPTGLDDDRRSVDFNILSGTSMSSPHISGIAALLRSVHPDWSPGAIKSAMMTSAYVADKIGNPILNEDGTESNPYAYGAGHVDPEKALNPGLIYDVGTLDYFNYLCALNYNQKKIRAIDPHMPDCGKHSYSVNDLNYPSFETRFDKAMPSPHVTSFTRTVTNVGSPKSTYKVSVTDPVGTKITVKPSTLKFSSLKEKHRYTVTISAVPESYPLSQSFTFGSVIWSDGTFNVRSSVAVAWQNFYR